MSKDNKIIRERLEEIYGHICMMHEGLKINGYKKSKVRYTGKAIERQLTLHHLKPRRLGGKTTVENGAVLCRGCHDYLEQTSPEDREKLNDLLREYKRCRYKRCRVEVVDNLDIGISLNIAEIEVQDKSIRIRKRELQAKRKMQEKRELQKIRKEWEDR